MYVIQSKTDTPFFRTYVILVVDEVTFLLEEVSYDLSQTEVHEDATKFKYITDALCAMETLKLHEDDWEVVPLEV